MVAALIVVLSGRVAEEVGKVLHIGHAAVRTWDVAKWLVLVLLVSIMLAVLYWAAPNVRVGG